jgi:hypothetical protein
MSDEELPDEPVVEVVNVVEQPAPEEPVAVAEEAPAEAPKKKSKTSPEPVADASVSGHLGDKLDRARR